MNSQVSIQTALRLPAPDIEALIQGRMISAMPRMFINPTRQFALYPAETSTNALSTEKYYRSSFLPTAQLTLAELSSETVLIKAWAKCELCQIVNDLASLEALSQLTVWTAEALQEILQQYPHIFLAHLRVYQLPQTVVVPVSSNTQQAIGKFVGLSIPLNLAESFPVLSDRVFAQRRQKLEKLEPPDHPELEDLQGAIAQLATINPFARQLDQDIKLFLGATQDKPTIHSEPDLGWITTIATVGNSIDGNGFEKLVRKGLLKLGFTNSNANPKMSLDPDGVGGAGGLDFYCEAPYPVVGECKATATEKVPDGTAAQLVKLGYKHLQRQYNRCIKIIMAAGELTEDAELTASGNEMNVIRPETLQRLVELKAKHPGAIDLLDLKPCLEQEPFGEAADAKVNRYIDNLWQNIKLRSHIIQLIKRANREIGIEYLSGAYDASNPPKTIFNIQEMHEILIELSSPLTGYLGRIKGSDWRSDRFYFLRDLQVN
jgi:hypothetical protein